MLHNKIMEKILTMKLPLSNSEIHSYFVISDLHSHHLHLPTFNILLNHAKRYEECGLILNGDLFDLVFMMKKNPNYQKWIKRADGCETFFIPEWEKECQIVNLILDDLQKVFKKIIFINGNHDSLRIEEFVQTIPFEYRHHFDYRQALRLQKRGITAVNYGVWLDVGDVSIIHGMYHNVNCHKTHHDECGKSVIFGHIHKGKMMPFKQRKKTHHVWSLPCVSTLCPEYNRKRTNDWDNGYGVLNVRNTGKFNFNLFIVDDDRLVLPTGEIIHADSKVL